MVNSLLTAIVRADGDALVMHVGERPYVVASSGPVELSSRPLTLEAVAGMLGQLLPVDSRRALEELGAVEHELPPSPAAQGDRFTVVAARGGDDIWVEVRRHRRLRMAARPPVPPAAATLPAPAAAVTPAPTPVSASEAPTPAPLVVAAPEPPAPAQQAQPAAPAAQEAAPEAPALPLEISAPTAVSFPAAPAPVPSSPVPPPVALTGEVAAVAAVVEPAPSAGEPDLAPAQPTPAADIARIVAAHAPQPYAVAGGAEPGMAVPPAVAPVVAVQAETAPSAPLESVAAQAEGATAGETEPAGRTEAGLDAAITRAFEAALDRAAEPVSLPAPPRRPRGSLRPSRPTSRRAGTQPR